MENGSICFNGIGKLSCVNHPGQRADAMYLTDNATLKIDWPDHVIRPECGQVRLKKVALVKVTLLSPKECSTLIRRIICISKCKVSRLFPRTKQ